MNRTTQFNSFCSKCGIREELHGVRDQCPRSHELFKIEQAVLKCFRQVTAEKFSEWREDVETPYAVNVPGLYPTTHVQAVNRRRTENRITITLTESV